MLRRQHENKWQCSLPYALACVQTPPLSPQEKSMFPEGKGGSVHRLLWPYVGSFPIISSLLPSRSLSRHATLETKNGCEVTRLTPVSPHFRAWHRRSCCSTHRPTMCNGVPFFTQFVFHWTLSNGGQVILYSVLNNSLWKVSVASWLEHSTVPQQCVPDIHSSKATVGVIS